MKKLMKSQKFEDYKKSEVSAPWAILGGEQWVDTVYYNSNNVLCKDIADKETYVEAIHAYLEGDVHFSGEPAPPIVS